LRHAVRGISDEGGADLPGLTMSAATMSSLLDARDARPGWSTDADLQAADAVLVDAIESRGADGEPLAALVENLGLHRLELLFLLLVLAPEFDPRYQRCIGLLLDDLGRRVGTLGLYSSLIGDPAEVRWSLAQSGNLARWRLLDTRSAGLPYADEPLRADAVIAAWLLGQGTALDHDPRVRRVARQVSWAGTTLVDSQAELDSASELLHKLVRSQEIPDARWPLLTGDPAPGWCPLIERSCELTSLSPIRIDAKLLEGIEAGEVEETGVRLGRLACLTKRPLVLDATSMEISAHADDALQTLLDALGRLGCRAAIICTDAARMVRLLGPMPCSVFDRRIDAQARASGVQSVAQGLDVPLPEGAADALAQLYPLHPDGFEHAMRLARARFAPDDDGDRRYRLFIGACQDVAAEGVSRLADRINPAFKLSDVVLPSERQRQLTEIVDSVRFAKKVLDDWKFREQLPYGRAVTALFHGPSGCGKTMSALGIARELGIQVLRIDLSRIVSKYVGDTEKNIDRIFTDARNCGAAILIDEADALLGKRSDIKDAQDRHANVEVSYLLQRIEAYEEGLAIFTTNLRQNIDSAFLRRLRFVIDFPRPDVGAREEIWRRCLPQNSHALDDAAFRQLARKIDLTGGHIRQITLRAAFVAAAANSQITLHHIAHASRAEMAKLGLPPPPLDLPPLREVA
jgi:AAA+ superfamily predicted ATPase